MYFKIFPKAFYKKNIDFSSELFLHLFFIFKLKL